MVSVRGVQKPGRSPGPPWEWTLGFWRSLAPLPSFKSLNPRGGPSPRRWHRWMLRLLLFYGVASGLSIVAFSLLTSQLEHLQLPEMKGLGSFSELGLDASWHLSPVSVQQDIYVAQQAGDYACALLLQDVCYAFNPEPSGVPRDSVGVWYARDGSRDLSAIDFAQNICTLYKATGSSAERQNLFSGDDGLDLPVLQKRVGRFVHVDEAAAYMEGHSFLKAKLTRLLGKLSRFASRYLPVPGAIGEERGPGVSTGIVSIRDGHLGHFVEAVGGMAELARHLAGPDRLEPQGNEEGQLGDGQSGHFNRTLFFPMSFRLPNWTRGMAGVILGSEHLSIRVRPVDSHTTCFRQALFPLNIAHSKGAADFLRARAYRFAGVPDVTPEGAQKSATSPALRKGSGLGAAVKPPSKTAPPARRRTAEESPVRGGTRGNKTNGAKDRKAGQPTQVQKSPGPSRAARSGGTTKTGQDREVPRNAGPGHSAPGQRQQGGSPSPRTAHAEAGEGAGKVARVTAVAKVVKRTPGRASRGGARSLLGVPAGGRVLLGGGVEGVKGKRATSGRPAVQKPGKDRPVMEARIVRKVPVRASGKGREAGGPASPLRGKEAKKAPKAAGPPKVRYQITVVRRMKTRLLANMVELELLLKKVFPGLPLEEVKLETLSLEEQIRVMQRTALYVTMHGAAMSNAVMLQPGATVLELFPYKFAYGVYRRLCLRYGLEHVSWHNAHLNSSSYEEDCLNRGRFVQWSEHRCHTNGACRSCVRDMSTTTVDLNELRPILLKVVPQVRAWVKRHASR